MNIYFLKKQLRGLTTRAAIVTLTDKYHRAKMTIVFDSQMYTLKTLAEELEDCLLDMPCGEFGILRFWGGPPGEGEWHDGTMLTMLCDAILFEEHTQHLSEAEKQLA